MSPRTVTLAPLRQARAEQLELLITKHLSGRLVLSHGGYTFLERFSWKRPEVDRSVNDLVRLGKARLEHLEDGRIVCNLSWVVD